MALMKFVRIQLNQHGIPPMLPPYSVQTDDPVALKKWLDEEWPEHNFTLNQEVISEEDFKARVRREKQERS